MSKKKRSWFLHVVKNISGKPVTTSVPSISIKFHANVEQIEELYTSEDENNTYSEKGEKITSVSSSPSNIVITVSRPLLIVLSIITFSTPYNVSVTRRADSSPLRYLPRLVKRSTSIDVSQTQPLDASPPSDPWRFFSDIKVIVYVRKSRAGTCGETRRMWRVQSMPWEEANFKTDFPDKKTVNNDDVLKLVVQKFDNMELDTENVLNVKEVTSKDMRNSFLESH
ncbi:hypothetical protein NQ314_007662 [Rhamnusium bicolor]|uniref:Uncharacterized protein n=1 Tax=Rhamnusium bicolor TaxID=1586634 RepID=A0AAV8YK98_9CUCU|nr:hypothetical protein NQ314_007662 [Rhamnusium bicolor]